MWQVPFYVDMVNVRHWRALIECTQASLGDGIISVTAYLLAIVASGRDQIGRFRKRAVGWSVYLGAGLIITVGLELIATKVLDRWQYSELMPVIPFLDIGLLPILQWSLLPPLILWLSWTLVRGWEIETD